MTRNSRVSAAAHINSAVASVNITEPMIPKKILRLYPKFVNYILEKYANDQTIADIDSIILRYIQPAHMTPIQYDVDLYAKSCKVANLYDTSTVDKIGLRTTK